MANNTTDFRTNACSDCPLASNCTCQLYELDDEMYCADKLTELGYGICDDCGAVVREDALTQVSTGGNVCESCLEDNYTCCDDCGDWVPNDDIRIVDHDTYVCESCLEGNSNYFFCEDCNEWYSYRWDSSHYIEGFGEVCEHCFEYGDYGYCDNCDQYFHRDDLVYDEENDRDLCRNCYAELTPSGDERHKIQQYRYKPVPKPRTRKRCTCDSCNDIPELLFGLELEVDKGPYENRDKAVSDIADASEDVYMKHDGSLDTGFEIVTHPCTLEYHMYEFKWRHITSIARKYGFKSHDARTCGLHVHVGRYQLGNGYAAQRETIGKILLLVDRHWSPLVTFSRRQESQLNHWAARPSIDRRSSYSSEAQAIDAAMAADNDNRYQAVNLCNSGTIEFRLFNGTLKRDTIIATIQLLSNLCLYAKSHSVTECLESKWEDLVGFTQYDELNEYCKTQGLTNIQAEPRTNIQADPSTSVASAEPLTIDQIAVGMAVRPRSSVFGLPTDAIGVVQCVEDAGRVLPVGVAFYGYPNWDGGHDLGGRLGTNIGRWFDPEDLIPA